MATAQWFAIRLDFLCIIYTLIVSIVCFALRGCNISLLNQHLFNTIISFFLNIAINGSEAGLIICSVGEILGWFEYGICLANDMENDLISIERTLEYSRDLPSEKEKESLITPSPLKYSI